MALRRTFVLLAVVGSIALVAGPATAGTTRDVTARSGSCSGGPGHWRLTVTKLDAGYLRIRYRIDTEEAGDKWQVFLSDGLVGVFAGTRVSNDDGIILVKQRTRDLLGLDQIKASAFKENDGESCSGSVTV